MTAPVQPTTDPGQAPETPPPAPEGAAPAAPATPETPPWGQDFDPARAWKTIQNLREAEKEKNTLAARVKEFEDAQKSEAEKAAERLAAAEKTAADREVEALRYRALVKHKLDEEDLDLLGVGTAEEIDARAARLAARSSGTKAPAGRKPQERLRGGSDPEQEPELDPEKAADAIRGRNRY